MESAKPDNQAISEPGNLGTRKLWNRERSPGYPLRELTSMSTSCKRWSHRDIALLFINSR